MVCRLKMNNNNNNNNNNLEIKQKVEYLKCILKVGRTESIRYKKK